MKYKKYKKKGFLLTKLIQNKMAHNKFPSNFKNVERLQVTNIFIFIGMVYNIIGILLCS